MPELPEVQTVAQSLAARIVGLRVDLVAVHRADIVRGDASPAALLQGDVVDHVARHGKQLAIVGASGRCVCVHLGMSGSLQFLTGPDSESEWEAQAEANRVIFDRPKHEASRPMAERHRHIVWVLDGEDCVAFRDPRRFGGIWTFPSRDALNAARWSQLGPDALTVDGAELHSRLQRTTRPLKAALLAQDVVSGLGNIYVDELLFAVRIDPTRPAAKVTKPQAQQLASKMTALLQAAIDAGGSTLRDYVNADGAAGGFQHRHQVYGRAGQPCTRCESTLAAGVVAGRTTVWCPQCQRGRRGQQA